MLRLLIFSVANLLLVLASCHPPGHKETPLSGSDTLVSTKHPTDTIPTSFVISDSQAGPFKIGDEMPGRATMMTWRLRIEQQTRYTEEGPTTEEVIIISDGEEDLVHLKAAYSATDGPKKIGEILIVSPRFVTRKGISLNSSIGDFIRAYPDAKAWYTYVSNMTVLETSQLKVQFIVDRESFRNELPKVQSEKTDLPVSIFNPQSRIQLIRII